MSFDLIELKLKEGYWCFRKSKPNIHYYLNDEEEVIGFDVDKDFLSDYNGGEKLTKQDIIATDWECIEH